MAVDIPPELIDSVLQHAYYDSLHHRPDYGTLRACSTVCKSWMGPAQELLFSSVHLDTRTVNARASFLDLFNSSLPHTRSLVSSIKCLDLRSAPIMEDAVSDLITVITHCLSLYELVWEINSLALHAFNPTTVDTLERLANRTNAKPLRALRLPSFGTQSPLIYQLLQVWPSLRFVRLGQELGAPPPRTWTPTIQLHELVLFRVPRNVQAVKWMLSASIGHLRILQLRDEPGTAYDEILEVHGPYLESLRLYSHSKRTSTILRMCPNLKEFAITVLSTFLPLSGIPASVEHLNFHNYDWAPSKSLSAILNAIDDLPKLRIVSCDGNGINHAEWSILRQKCQQRSIQLRADAPPIYVLDDPVPAQQYPRYKSVSNFAVMNNS